MLPISISVNRMEFVTSRNGALPFQLQNNRIYGHYNTVGARKTFVRQKSHVVAGRAHFSSAIPRCLNLVQHK